MNYEAILNAYWPVIEQAIEVQKHYNGKLDGVPKICPDVTGEMIKALVKARLKYPLTRTVEECQQL